MSEAVTEAPKTIQELVAHAVATAPMRKPTKRTFAMGGVGIVGLLWSCWSYIDAVKADVASQAVVNAMQTKTLEALSDLPARTRAIEVREAARDVREEMTEKRFDKIDHALEKILERLPPR